MEFSQHPKEDVSIIPILYMRKLKFALLLHSWNTVTQEWRDIAILCHNPKYYLDSF